MSTGAPPSSPSLHRPVRLALLGIVASPAIFVVIVVGVSILGERSLADKTEGIAARLATDRSDARLEQVAAENGVRISIYAADGRLLRRADRSPRNENAVGVASMAEPADLPDDEMLTPILREALDISGSAHGCETRADGGTLLCTSARRRHDGSFVVVDRGVVRGVGRYLERPLPLLSLMFIALLAGLGLSRWLTRQLVQPLVALRDGVRDRLRGSTSPIPRAGPSEVGDVAHAFEELLAHLAEQRVAKEHFVADLAHELKTPLASIRAAQELLDGTQSSEERTRLLQTIDRATRRIDATLLSLLELSRVEARMGAIEISSLDELARGVVNAIEEERAVKSIAIAITTEPVEIEMRPLEIERALRTLLENALSFAKEQVEVRIQRTDAGARIVVRDDGPGFPPDVPVFNRFVSNRPGGTGLGLALVAAVARNHGGSARVDYGEGGCVVVELRTPLGHHDLLHRQQ